jgi:YegS/Rv2252/BmrU family lipid kinase
MNPYAGMRKGAKALADIIAIFNRADYEVITYMTAGPGDGRPIVAKQASQVDLVVCAGGDGTFNETVNGILESGCDTPVGYIPCGSTNDFASSLQLQTNPVKAAQAIVDGDVTRYDIGKFGDRYFSYVASFGAFTKTSYNTPQSVKNALGHTAYLLSCVQELSQIRKEHLLIETSDQVIEDDFIFGAISNSTSVGGILTLDPKQVDMRDGKFELLLVRAPRDLLELSDCIRALQTQKYNCAMITFLSTSSLTVYANPEMDWSLDGERQAGSDRIFVENLYHAISIQK